MADLGVSGRQKTRQDAGKASLDEYTSRSERSGRVGVVVATLGRPESLRYLLEHLDRQTLHPHRVVLSLEKAADCPDLAGLNLPIELVFGPRGVCLQRNRGLDKVRDDCDVVVFFDDDYVPCRHALAGIVEAFRIFPFVGGVTGHLLADGINGPGIRSEDAAAMVAREETPGDLAVPRILERLEGLYGCNMAFRTEAIGDLQFDENLPLYAWQEDIDFSACVRGEMVRTDAFFGVHCGLKSGRERVGKRLGYSQIANNWYLLRKGTMTPRLALRHASRNILKNHLRALWPEPWIDRRGRAIGNWIAIIDLVRGRCRPERIVEF